MSGNRPQRVSRLWNREGMPSFRKDGVNSLMFWGLALVIGCAAGWATLGFRVGISALQTWIYGESDVQLASAASQLPWFWVLVVPVIGGLIVGIILQRYTPDGRVRTVAHAIEGAALNNGKVEGKAGLASAVASFITLSTGGSSGREGPVVHLAAVISSKVSRLIKANGITARDLLGCAVASAVAASFNAPIAGTIFAMEVVLRHYAVHSFGPIVLASVCGALISRFGFGDITEFTLPSHELEFYVELPAFVLLGIVCGIVAVIMMKSIFLAEDWGDEWQQRFKIPGWLRPAIAGLVLGSMAIWVPNIIGVGYETTFLALTGQITFWGAVGLAVVKVAAVAVTMAGRMGGGAFSPALMLGALTGLAFGWVATAIFPTVSGTLSLYALAGMGAVGAAVLGAPISTTLIVFEMTGDWQMGLAVMLAVALSTTVAGRFVARSFFLEQLERRGVRLAAGPQAYLLATLPVSKLMRGLDHPRMGSRELCDTLIKEGAYVMETSSLEAALPLFDGATHQFLPVVSTNDSGEVEELLGTLFQVDALRAYSEAMAETVREHHA
ncbi:chloride channel protein [Neptunicoccus cionae]|uniref:Chloride channel protein n=1 Tax=Neptunicoccus cionae TaxID=2035344 RepID=A0A916QSQ4_9RHOB|nr:chloride channel protein [Amylibacter cionae]